MMLQYRNRKTSTGMTLLSDTRHITRYFCAKMPLIKKLLSLPPAISECEQFQLFPSSLCQVLAETLKDSTISQNSEVCKYHKCFVKDMLCCERCRYYSHVTYMTVVVAEFKLAQIDMYRQRLKERQRWKVIAREFGLLQNACSTGLCGSVTNNNSNRKTPNKKKSSSSLSSTLSSSSLSKEEK